MPSVEAADAAAPAAAEYLRKLRRSMPSGEPSRRSSIALPLLAEPVREAPRGRGEKPAGDGRRTVSCAGRTAPRPDLPRGIRSSLDSHTPDGAGANDCME